MNNLPYHEADLPTLAAALGGYAAQMQWNLTCLAATAAERELAAHHLASARRLLAAAGEPAPPVTFGDTGKRRIAASGADPWALMAILSTGPGGDPLLTMAARLAATTEPAEGTPTA
jgi:hypothetical protein